MIEQIKTIFKKVQKRNKISKIESLAKQQEIKLVVGAGKVFQTGWIDAEQDDLDVLKDENWARFFKPDSIDNILAEHVWEHLTPEGGQRAMQLCFKYLKKGGRLRLAVPDGYHPSKAYIENVRPGGHGSGAFDHKILYTVDIMREFMEKAGFMVYPLEYYDQAGVFHANDWDPKDGMVHRSLRFDPRNSADTVRYTSLIVDGVK